MLNLMKPINRLDDFPYINKISVNLIKLTCCKPIFLTDKNNKVIVIYIRFKLFITMPLSKLSTRNRKHFLAIDGAVFQVLFLDSVLDRSKRTRGRRLL